MSRLRTIALGATGLLLAAVFVTGCSPDENAAARTDDIFLAPVMDLDSLSFDRFREAGSPAIVEFGGRRCINCLQMRENLDALRDSLPALRVGYVHWEDAPELFDAWDVTLIPTQIVFDAHGNELLRHQGMWETGEMRRALSRAELFQQK